MRITINSRYKRTLTVLVWLIAIVSTIMSFFTLPIIVAASVSAASLILAVLVNFAVYRYAVVALHRPVAHGFDQHWIGSVWGVDDQTGQPFYGLLYETKEAAKSAYKSFRVFSNGKYVDDSGEIQLRVVRETENKFSVFVYPKRGGTQIKNLQHQILSNLPPNSQLKTIEYVPFIQNCADYSDISHLTTKKLLCDLNTKKELFLNAYFVKNEQVVAYSTKEIRLTNFRLVAREDLTAQDIEYNFKWHDFKKEQPLQYNRAKSLEKNLPGRASYLPVFYLLRLRANVVNLQSSQSAGIPARWFHPRQQSAARRGIFVVSVP